MPHFQQDKTYGLFDTIANRKLIAEVQASGAETVLFPAVEISAAKLDSENAELLADLTSFDWVIFPNVFAAEYFLTALETAALDFFELDALRICAFGESVSDRLRFSQVHADVISNTAEAAEALAALTNYEPDYTSLRFLIPASDSAQTEIAALLQNAGATVTKLAVYHAGLDANAPVAKLKTLLKGGAIDSFIFSAPAEITVFAILFQPEKPADLLSDIEIIARDYPTYQSLSEYGLDKIKML